MKGIETIKNDQYGTISLPRLINEKSFISNDGRKSNMDLDTNRSDNSSPHKMYMNYGNITVDKSRNKSEMRLRMPSKLNNTYDVG